MMSNPQPIQDTAYLFRYVSHENDRPGASWWIGEPQVLKSLGVDPTAEVGKSDFISMANGTSPRSDEKLVFNAGKENRRKGKEFSLSAPKSFGILYELADESMKLQFDRCDKLAVNAALAYLRQHIRCTKNSAGQKEPPHSLFAAAFKHRTNRDDAILHHTHVELMNLGMDGQGQMRGLDFRALFDHKKQIGAVYRQVLANELIKLGFAIERDRFSWRIAGLPREADEHFSGRTRHIDALYEERAMQIAQAEGKKLDPAQRAGLRQAIALATRKSKSSTSIGELNQHWKEGLGERFGLSSSSVADLMQGDGQQLHQLPDFDAVFRHITSKARLTHIEDKELHVRLLELKALHPLLDVAGEMRKLESCGAITRDGRAVRFDQDMLDHQREQMRQARTRKSPRRISIQPRTPSLKPPQACRATQATFRTSLPARAPATKVSQAEPSAQIGSPAPSTAGLSPQEAMRARAFHLQQQAAALVISAMKSKDARARDELYGRAAVMLQKADTLYFEASRISERHAHETYI